MSRWFRDMARTSKTDPSDTPRIDAVVPGAALLGGEVELAGSNLGPFAMAAPVAMLGQLAASVLLSRSKRLRLRVPEEAESGALQILQNGAQSNSVKLLVAGM